jgi:hypothetical protein
MTTTMELAIALLAVACGTWSAWREQRRAQARRQRWETLAAELDRYRAYFQGGFPKNVTVPDGDGPAGHYEIRRRPAEPAPAPQPEHSQNYRHKL